MKILLLVLSTIFCQHAFSQSDECRTKAQAVRDAYEKFIEEHEVGSEKTTTNLNDLKGKCSDFISEKCNQSHTIFPKKVPIQEACMQFETGV